MFQVKIISKWLDQCSTFENLFSDLLIMEHYYVLSYLYLYNSNFGDIFF